MTDKMGWIEYNEGKTIGTKGSEDGIIIKDEEYQESCAITLERTERGYAITCSIKTIILILLIYSTTEIQTKQSE